MQEVDTGTVPSELNSREQGGRAVITISSADELTQELPEYHDRSELSPSRTGLNPDSSPSWEKEVYEIERGTVLARLLTSIENCVLLEPLTEEGYNALDGIDPDPFGGLVVASVPEELNNLESQSVLTIKQPQYLVVLYSVALLIVQYEKELSNRVLNGVSETLVESVNRKYNKQKRNLKSRLSKSSASTEELTIPVEEFKIYRITLPGTVPGLFE